MTTGGRGGGRVDDFLAEAGGRVPGLLVARGQCLEGFAGSRFRWR